MRLFAALVVLLASGCATTDKVDTSSGPPGSACVKGSIPNLAAFYGAGTQAIIQIREIDGKPVKPEGWRSHCVSPGKHQVGFLADSPDQYSGFRVADYVDLQLSSSDKYVLRGDFLGINLVLHVLEVGAESSVLVQDIKYKISGHVNSQPIVIPTPIVTHH